MNNSAQSALLARAAGQASQCTVYLGWLFRRYSEVEAATEEVMCARLGISALDFQRLRLCLRPRRNSFAADVEQIAAKFALDAGELAGIIRHVEAMEAMRQDVGDQQLEDVGLMLAARARGRAKEPQRKVDDHGKRKKQ